MNCQSDYSWYKLQLIQILKVKQNIKQGKENSELQIENYV